MITISLGTKIKMRLIRLLVVVTSAIIILDVHPLKV